ncbi:DNA repair protein REV1 isoform X2 [Tachysurus fulvidraco]|uniref:DNA repair protein REV1 isoform X2 n=1 Tax=Tachysurus fulvidraco TaxID=1234273 RepID=UPI001FF05E0C|nr:DNA repair protein REV1 isoform X2 [Tachysurus fulvidraco]
MLGFSLFCLFIASDSTPESLSSYRCHGNMEPPCQRARASKLVECVRRNQTLVSQTLPSLFIGGYMAAKVSKLEEQFMRDAPREKQKLGTSSSIFNGVAIHVNGYTDPSADELRRLMMLHGGQFHVYYSHTKTTHIIATNLPNFKIQELRGEKVVRPEWITDSIKAGRQLSYLQYQLYAKQKGLNFTSVCPRKVQEQSGLGQGPSQFNFNLPQPSDLHNFTNPAFTVPQTVPSKPSEKTVQQMVNRLNGSPISVSKEEGPKLNGVHDRHTCKVSKGHLQKNGYFYPLNGALKKDNVSCSKSIHQEADFRCPQPKGCSSSSGLASDFTASIASTSLLASPSRASHHELPSATVAALQEEQIDSDWSLGQSSRVRLNGSHHNTSNITLTAKQSAQGTETGIISEFFSHSRLHHISTWRNEFSEYVNTLQSRRRAAGGVVFSGKEKLKKLRTDHCAGTSFMPAPQVYKSCILHVDMDCFFASVGIRHRPELGGKPVAVTSNRGRGLVPQRPGANPQLEFQYYQKKRNQHRAGTTGDDIELTPSPETEETVCNGVEHDKATLSMAEIASCSYEARQAGVRNGMFFGQAKQLCPELQSVPYDFHAYKEVALAMYETLASYTFNIEALSCDEALVDATSLLAELGITPDELATAIRSDVREKTGCCASIGMSSNILLARMATRKAKPNGQYFLRSEEVDDFIRDQPVTSLPGVGRSMSSKLASLGVNTCGDLQQLSIVRLQKEFGPRTGQTLFRFCRGLDDRLVRNEKERKSVSAEMNYNIRFTTVEEAETFLTNLSMEVQKRLQGAGLRGRRVTMKVMMRKAGAPVEPAKYGGHGICDNLARSVLLPHPTDCGQLIAAEVIKLFRAMKLAVIDMRGVGLQMHLLESSHSDAGPSRFRTIRELLTSRRPTFNHSKDVQKTDDLSRMSSNQKEIFSPTTNCCTFSDSMPGTSKGGPSVAHSPSHSRADLNLSIEVPSPSQVDQSVLDALPPELREQVEQAWNHKQVPDTSFHPVTSQQSFTEAPSVLLVPDQPGQTVSTGIILELPDFSQVDPDVFAALPKELQEELYSAYRRRQNTQAQVEQRNPLLYLKQSAVNKTKRRYKRKNASPAKKGTSPLKRLIPGNSPAKSSPSKTIPLLLKGKEALAGFKMENGPPSSTLSHQVPEELPKCTTRPVPTLAGAFELSDVRALMREWVTTISEPMEEDILQVVKYCTELIEDKDLEKLDLVIKYMKRLMQQSVESVWSMAFDFILDNVQVVVQQTYGSTLKIT